MPLHDATPSNEEHPTKKRGTTPVPTDNNDEQPTVRPVTLNRSDYKLLDAAVHSSMPTPSIVNRTPSQPDLKLPLRVPAQVLSDAGLLGANKSSQPNSAHNSDAHDSGYGPSRRREASRPRASEPKATGPYTDPDDTPTRTVKELINSFNLGVGIKEVMEME